MDPRTDYYLRKSEGDFPHYGDPIPALLKCGVLRGGFDAVRQRDNWLLQKATNSMASLNFPTGRKDHTESTDR